jgi:hypothetical protein
MSKYRIYYNKECYATKGKPTEIEADSFHFKTVREPGFMTDTVDFYKHVETEHSIIVKVKVAEIQRVDSVIDISCIPPK